MRALAHVIDDAQAVQAARSRPFPWMVTQHAVDRYRERVEPRLEPAGARIALEGLLVNAWLLPDPTNSGQQRWMLSNSRGVVVCKPDPRLRVRVAVTVLGPNEMFDLEAADVVEAYRRATAPPEPPVPAPAPVSPPRSAAPSSPAAAPPKPAAAARRDGAGAPHWEQAYRAIERRYDSLQVEHQRLLAAHVVLKQKRDSETAPLRQELATAREAAHRHREQARAAETRAESAGRPEPPGQVDRLREHAEKMDRERRHMRDLLRVAIRSLRGIDAPDSAYGLAGLEVVEPGITADQFCFPDRFTKEERRAAKAAARRSREEAA